MKIKKGFTTAEMLITILIFSLGILPLIILFQNSHKQTAQAKNLMIAQSIGRSVIAELRAKGFDYLAKEKNNPDPTNPITHVGKIVEGKCVDSDDTSIVYPEYYKRFKTTVSLDDSGERSVLNVTKPANKIRVMLEVEWQESNRKFSLAFATVVVKYDT